MSLNKLFNLAVKYVITGNKPEFFHNNLRKVSDYALIVRNKITIKLGFMGNISARDIAKNNFSFFCFRKFLKRNLLVAEFWYIKTRKIFIFAINAGGKNGNLYIHSLNVLFHILAIDFNHERTFWIGAFAHLSVFKLNALAFDRLHKIHECIGAYNADKLRQGRIAIHSAQASAKRLFGQNIALRDISP